MTAPVTDTAPTVDSGTTGDGGAGGTEGQAPESGNTPERRQPPAGPGAAKTRPERVRSSSRDDDAPREHTDDDTDNDDDGDGAGRRGSKQRDGDWKVEDLPSGAQKMIADLRKEAGTRRTEAAEARKTGEAAKKQAAAVDEKFASAVEAFTKALGLTPDADEPERSPEERLGEITTQYRQKTVELAVYRAAGQAGADPEALLDSRGFLTKAFALDPAGDEFSKSIAEAIAEAVESNPKLRAEEPYQPPAVASGGDFGGGPAERNDPDEWSVDDFRRERNKARGNAY